jgi:putative flippase GtrA
VIKYFLTKQFVLFLCVGATAAFLHWLSRIVLSRWLTFSWAVVCAYAVGMFVAFVLNRYFVFPNSTKSMHRQARDFFIVNLCFFPVVWGASMALNHWLSLAGVVRFRQALAHGMAVAVPMVATFLIYKFLAFKDARYGRT